ncbi:MAG: tetratricopeptide repeat protein [Myxococcales bacterium]
MVRLLVLGLLLNGTPDARQQADRLVQAATVDYNASDFAAALAKLTEAYKLRPDPALLFDMAQCHRALHHWERAEFTYKAYLTQRSDARDRKKVKALIAKMHEERDREQAEAVAAAKAQEANARAAEEEARAKEAAAPPAAPNPPPAAPPPPSQKVSSAPAAATEPPAVRAEAAPHRKIPVASWVLGGVGAAALLGGGWFAYENVSLMGQNHSTTAADGLPAYSISYRQFQTAQSDAAVADICFIAGGVLLLTSVILAVASPSHALPSPSTEAF